MGHPARRLVLYKRWRLRDGVTIDRVATLVADRVIPHYRVLSEKAVLGLEALDDRTVLAIQRWPDRAARDEAMNAAGFEGWWREYLPILAEWEIALELEEEWESEVLLGWCRTDAAGRDS